MFDLSYVERKNKGEQLCDGQLFIFSISDVLFFQYCFITSLCCDANFWCSASQCSYREYTPILKSNPEQKPSETSFLYSLISELKFYFFIRFFAGHFSIYAYLCWDFVSPQWDHLFQGKYNKTSYTWDEHTEMLKFSFIRLSLTQKMEENSPNSTEAAQWESSTLQKASAESLFM